MLPERRNEVINEYASDIKYVVTTVRLSETLWSRQCEWVFMTPRWPPWTFCGRSVILDKSKVCHLQPQLNTEYLSWANLYKPV